MKKFTIKDKVDENVCDLSLNQLSEIPVGEILKFKRITTLDISSNNIVFLGKNFGSLVQLIKLDLSKNEIKFLPESIGNLINLKHLDLFNNKIENLPVSFSNLKRLQYLDLRKNPLTPELQTVVGPCLTSKDCVNSAKQTIMFMEEDKLRKQAEEDRLKRKQLKLLKEVAKALKRISRKDEEERSNQQKIFERPIKPEISLETSVESLGKIATSRLQKFKCFIIFFVLNVIGLVLVIILMPETANNLKNKFQLKRIFENIYNGYE